MTDYATIVVATDLSDPALPAVHHGGALAKQLGSRLVLTYVIEDRIPPGLAQSVLEQISQRHHEHARESLARCAAEHLSGLDVEIAVCEGSPHIEIVELAQKSNASMIVIGMHGHGFIKHALAGSTAERVLHHAPCPVLVVGR